ncbi:PhoX family protein [Paenactinomyces guangxiensis]|uniref:PhoX family phosphatase n=1 Tax=Paenactinomyces guangxiensis TaxID=1490290 RepID=A0A7W2A7D5_9BACL|nr:PhoX family phosphatase [Paenactinomyces guangxiensis]MBA4493024.1 PhoX family phosphatase [Paenactinomyces guangxiensis]MBH8590127.1 PhoX family phosphatase [Paenactinomyces guangxiensis]
MAENHVSRRDFMKFVGIGTAALVGSATGVTRVAEAAGKAGESTKTDFFQKIGGRPPFRPIDPSDKDALILPPGFKQDIVVAWGDDIGNGEKFGYNCDLTLFFPIKKSSHHGLLWVNHEYVGTGSLFMYNAATPEKKKHEIEQYNVGGSIIEVKRVNGKWILEKNSTYARRITANTMIDLTGPAKGDAAVGGVTEVKGTHANCSGGKTLWNTALSCEENFESDADRWGRNATHYGWVVEVDPFAPESKPKKHTALGRFAHENTAMTLSKDGRLVVYMGDDANNQFFYKFVSQGKYDPTAGKANSKLLEKGILYAAELGNGKWLPLDLELSPKLKETFSSQGEVLVKAREAAKLLGATPLDRPEDVEVHPIDKTVYLALTNNTSHGNFHGQIVRFKEDGNDAASLRFEFEVFAVGGPQSGFSCPDNLLFDKKGNLWVFTDISSSKMNQDNVYESFKNNGAFFISTQGRNVGEAFQFASGPRECEMTGPDFTPDEKTLFIAVQHPGEETSDPAKPTSNWPYGDIPRPAVVAIQGF